MNLVNLFARGEYAREYGDAGMLGYIQTGNPDTWAQKIANSLARNPKKHCIEKDGGLKTISVVTELTFTYRSRHRRATVGDPITVIHTLLSFC